MPSADSPSRDTWTQALAGDRDAFEAAVAPYQDDLFAAARRLLDVHRAQTGRLDPADGTPGDNPDVVDGRPGTDPAVDLTAEELVGETLIRAFERRASFDASRMSLRAWLLGLESRALARFTRQEALYTDRKALSLDEQVPTGEDQDAVEEALYEFRQPFDVTTYEDILAGSAPDDVELPASTDDRLSPDELAAVADADLSDVGSEAGRQAVVLHDEFELSLPEVAQILNASIKDTAEHLNLARANLRERIGSTANLADADPTTDSYTGDPLPDA